MSDAKDREPVTDPSPSPPRKRLSNEDFFTIQSQLAVFGGAVATLDLEGFLERIGTAEAVAPLIDPSAFIAGHEKMALVKSVAEAALVFKRAVVAAQKAEAELAKKAR